MLHQSWKGRGQPSAHRAMHLFQPLPAYSPGTAFALRIKFCLPTPHSKTYSLCQQPWLLPSAPSDSCPSSSKAKASLTPLPWAGSPYPYSHLRLHQVSPQHPRLPAPTLCNCLLSSSAFSSTKSLSHRRTSLCPSLQHGRQAEGAQ